MPREGNEKINVLPPKTTQMLHCVNNLGDYCKFLQCCLVRKTKSYLNTSLTLFYKNQAETLFLDDGSFVAGMIKTLFKNCKNIYILDFKFDFHSKLSPGVRMCKDCCLTHVTL